MIGDLDQPLPLARIDTIFLMVDLSDTSSSGIDALKDLKYDEAKREIFEYEVKDPVTGWPTGETREREEFTPSSLDGTFQIPGINSPVKFNLSNWQVNGIEWSTIFSQATTRNDVRIFSSPSLMVSHNSEKVHIMIEDERSIVRPIIMTHTEGEQLNQDLKIKRPSLVAIWICCPPRLLWRFQSPRSA